MGRPDKLDLLFADIALRGASSGIFAIISILLVLASVPRAVKFSIVLLMISHVCGRWGVLPDGLLFDAQTAHVLRVLGAATSIFLSWFLVAVFMETHRFAWLWILSGAVIFVGLVFVIDYRVLAIPLRIYAAIHFLGLSFAILSAASDDLMTKRRIARLGVSVLIVLCAIVLAVFGRPMVPEQDIFIPFVSNLVLLFTLVIFCIWLLQVNADHWISEPTSRSGDRTEIARENDGQRILTRKIEMAMQAGIWRNEGLTVAKLAQEVGAPEYQVRKAINQVLGYRNFSSLINESRIEAAKMRLASPAEGAVSIQEVAYDVGFSSLGPFNRAFRDATGQTPSEFRINNAHHALADS